MYKLDDRPNAEGVVYPDRDHPVVPPDARCQEVPTMIGNRYVRCNQPAVCVVDHRGTEIYWMCHDCGWHNVRNRGGKLLAGSIE
jgi:hypothetical protein